MDNKAELYHMPEPSTSSVTDARLCGSILYFDYDREGTAYRSGIRFKHVLATRTRAERCCKAWHIEAYDTLVEVEGSPWVEELRADTAERWRSEWEMHHYMIYLDSAGCFEVIAASWEVLREEVGSWSKT
jgi:hypothetical protein